MGNYDEKIEQLEKNHQDTLIVKMGTKFEKRGEGGYVINPEQENNYHALLEELKNSGKNIDKIVHLWMITLFEVTFPSLMQRGVYSFLFLVKAMGKQLISNHIDLWVVSNQLHDIENSDNAMLTFLLSVVNLFFLNFFIFLWLKRGAENSRQKRR